MTGLPKGRIFHIASPSEADRLQADGSLAPPSLAAEGFVHCSTEHQVVATTARYFEADVELVLVELNREAVDADLQWPEVYPGQWFPHLHRAISASEVQAILPWGPADRLSWPARPA